MLAKLRKFVRSRKGGISNTVIVIAVALLVASFILPIAIDNFTDVNTTAWDADVTSMWDIIPVIALLGVVLGVIAYAMRKKGIF